MISPGRLLSECRTICTRMLASSKILNNGVWWASSSYIYKFGADIAAEYVLFTVLQRAEFDANPAAFRTSYAAKQKELTDKLVAARSILRDVSASSTSCFLLPAASPTIYQWS